MDVINTAVLFIILLAVLLLGIEVGLLSKYFKNPIKRHLIYSGIYALALLALVAVVYPFYKNVLDIASSSFFFYMGIAVLSLIFGAITLYLWEKEEVYDGRIKITLALGFVPVSFSVIAIALSYLGDGFSLPIAGYPLVFNMLESGIIVALVMFLVMIFSYYTADFIEDYIQMDYSVIFGGIMVVLAFLFITIAFFLPNLVNTLNTPVRELTLMSVNTLAILIFAALVLMGIGVLYRKRHNRLV